MSHEVNALRGIIAEIYTLFARVPQLDDVLRGGHAEYTRERDRRLLLTAAMLGEGGQNIADKIHDPAMRQLWSRAFGPLRNLPEEEK